MSAKANITALAEQLGFNSSHVGDYRSTYRLPRQSGSNRQVTVNWAARGAVYSAELTRDTSGTPDQELVFTDYAKSEKVQRMLREVNSTPVAPKKSKNTQSAVDAYDTPQCKRIADILSKNGWAVRTTNENTHIWSRDAHTITLKCHSGIFITMAAYMNSDCGVLTLTRAEHGDLLQRVTVWATSDPRPVKSTQSYSTEPARIQSALDLIDEALSSKTPLDPAQLAFVRTIVEDARLVEQNAAELRLAGYVADMRRTLDIATSGQVDDWVKCEDAIIQRVRELTATYDRLRHDKN